ncbi:hypothetical protein P175DRAFT_0505256 [Aspergillus ochraceoroseus IBT 24754]|uniref:Uncharacterized protein n=1 Tax=Aspergillus ochraceoroseus IBT 24754 TaxID=1392256 RepID=A0A2T5LLG5_9EURO|nr:uncharacterized protein P175DRAFT_0505256 [Aspergillus ochraceoroseus IBT 24754]PTU17105.1 hypothetical protein P175DRAFT_0505256 [Aspergillus ochraceoroseus IBT 24754]
MTRERLLVSSFPSWVAHSLSQIGLASGSERQAGSTLKVLLSQRSLVLIPCSTGVQAPKNCQLNSFQVFPPSPLEEDLSLLVSHSLSRP